jgi:hypothetical protein
MQVKPNADMLTKTKDQKNVERYFYTEECVFYKNYFTINRKQSASAEKNFT